MPEPPRLTFAVHPHLQTLEEAAVLAAVALLPRHLAVLVPAAAVDALVADAALEEALAALAGNDAIVQACGAVSTDKAGTLVTWIICTRNTRGGVKNTLVYTKTEFEPAGPQWGLDPGEGTGN